MQTPFVLPNSSAFLNLSHRKTLSSSNSSNFSHSASLYSRRGFAEDRDPFRLKDSKGNYIFCYHCGDGPAPKTGANEVEPIPLSGSIGVQVSRGRPIMSCDYCSLHWHYDCLDPPLAHLPTPTQKWMCPNHIDHLHVRLIHLFLDMPLRRTDRNLLHLLFRPSLASLKEASQYKTSPPSINPITATSRSYPPPPLYSHTRASSTTRSSSMQRSIACPSRPSDSTSGTRSSASLLPNPSTRTG